MSLQCDTIDYMFMFALIFQDCSGTEFLECRSVPFGAVSIGYKALLHPQNAIVVEGNVRKLRFLLI